MHTASIDIYGLMMRGYYFTSMCIIVISIFIFLWSFEKRKPKTREIVTLAVMTALAVVGRLAFFMTPQVKPCAAIIIITGVMLGRQSGFLCGALTAFVSGFFFGQGPWTPWQMIAFGIIGFLSGVLFSKKNIKYAYNKWIISIYGFLATFVIYGFILDTATVFMYTDTPKTETFVATYLSGIGFNLIHAASTFVVLFLISNATIKKLERLKIKYKMFS
ncbi:ECF transporter S component [Eubacterium sp. AF15-50]|uniref:ECF transporter S component n=2 Tax=Eubacteriaceae TaxID=186806 RepID=A0ABR7F4T0_9FIRM|nr:ECF transporter S component [Eubacterium segne]RHR69933.1 ECF transporter S component [Eubacterium sp. AF16-48]RHR77329.1 ECF transporter S component [Eubacterium sp. AF15-50]